MFQLLLSNPLVHTYLFNVAAIIPAANENRTPSKEWKYSTLNQNAIHSSQVNGLTLNLYVKFLTRITPIEASPNISNVRLIFFKLFICFVFNLVNHFVYFVPTDAGCSTNGSCRFWFNVPSPFRIQLPNLGVIPIVLSQNNINAVVQYLFSVINIMVRYLQL